MGVTAVVCAGAGARGAYEAGALSVLLPWLLREDPDEEVMLLGTSAGAINAALFAGVLDRGRPPEEAVEDALGLWRSATPGQVFKPLGVSAPMVGARFALESLGLPVQVNSLLDTTPLRRTLARSLDWSHLHQNLSGKGWIGAAGVVATNCDTGYTNLFLQGQLQRVPPTDPLGQIDYTLTSLQPVHVQASAAIPVLFLPVRVAEAGQPGWYVDGGVRLNAPIKPALALGATRVVVVATTPDPDLPQSLPGERRPPDVFASAAVALRAILVDRMAEDVRHLRQVNGLVAASGQEEVSLPDRSDPYRRVPNLYIGPDSPEAISLVARRVFDRYYSGPAARLSDLGLLGTLMGGVSGVHAELYSFLFFDGRFHADLIDMGRRDAAVAVADGWKGQTIAVGGNRGRPPRQGS
ncbi:MAG TPA: patatin-like phospholipase family protein [Acidimicrobiales bacterium]|jgi:NTE family protein|nr:patatin-like phospholipase family protein [Acidimicrobiales bacterium]